MKDEKYWNDSEQHSERMMSSKNFEYISDEIGEKYLKWKERDIIFINAPTGSGKSYFMLHIFLKHLMTKGKKMLYLVNRKILKQQLEEELTEVREELFRETGHIDVDVADYIVISTYQRIENRLKENMNNLPALNQCFDCVVYDECHYFYADSNFNTSTELSYLYLRQAFQKKLQIYISATPDKIKEDIGKYMRVYQEKEEKNAAVESITDPIKERVKKYSIDSNYKYIRLSVFEKIEDLTDRIRCSIDEKKEKWLIFVDSIDRGKNLQKELLKNKKEAEKEVIFLDAHYRKEESTWEATEEIAKEKFSSRRVIISTAVMDNGVSFHDLELRNLVVLADEREIFIQMLGRKRKDGGKVNLYICKQNAEHFKSRKRHVEEVLKCYEHYKKNLERIDCASSQWYYGEPVRERYVEDRWNKNHDGCMLQQQYILNGLMTNDVSNRCIREFCYALDGLLIRNKFSIKRCLDLKLFYDDMIEKIEKDEYAFVKQQAEWLGVSEDEQESIICEAKGSIDKENLKILRQAIQEKLNESMNKEENIKWKLSIKDVIIYFLKKDDKYKDSEEKYIKKNDNPFTKEKFARCMKAAELPYIMEVKHRNKECQETFYIISEMPGSE